MRWPAGWTETSWRSRSCLFHFPQQVEQAADIADIVHIHDEWTLRCSRPGSTSRPKSISQRQARASRTAPCRLPCPRLQRASRSRAKSTPRDPGLKEEYGEYLKKRLEEIRKKEPGAGQIAHHLSSRRLPKPPFYFFTTGACVAPAFLASSAFALVGGRKRGCGTTGFALVIATKA